MKRIKYSRQRKRMVVTKSKEKGKRQQPRRERKYHREDKKRKENVFRNDDRRYEEGEGKGSNTTPEKMGGARGDNALVLGTKNVSG